MSRSLKNYYAGALAEDTVALHYEQNGFQILSRRWRGAAGEVDLVAQNDQHRVFIEVKKAKTHDIALRRLGQAQLNRICLAACEYANQESLPCEASPPNMRIDLAAVNEIGEISIIENISLNHI